MHHDRERGRVFPPVQVRTRWFGLLLALIIGTGFIPLGIYAYQAFAYERFAYEVDGENLILRFGWNRILIPARDIQQVDFLAEPGRLRRIRGTGIRGLQTGWYRLEGHGSVYRLTTRSENLVLIRTRPDATTARADTRYLVSPADPEGFMASVRAMMSGKEELRRFLPAAGPHPARDPVLMYVNLLVVPVTVLSAWLLIHGRRSLRYRVDARGIHIRHLFGEKTLPWDGIGEVKRLETPFRGWRVFGASLPGYYVGNFHAKGMGGFKIYATHLQPPLILLRSRIGSVILSPADADAMMDAIAEYRGNGTDGSGLRFH